MAVDGEKSIKLRLLGNVEVELDGTVLALGHRQQRLLAALAVLGPRPRRFLGELLWPDRTAQRAMGSLRTTVFNLSRQVPGAVGARGNNIALTEAVAVDLHELRESLQRAAATSDAVTEDPWFLAPGGAQLLPGWYDGWVMAEQDRLRTLYVNAVEHLARLSLEEGDFYRAHMLADNVRAVDPLRESAVRVSIEADLGLGNNAPALQTFRSFCTTMADELGAPPSRQITELMNDMRSA
ncbi:BTAD domain-containing putative transcriptional regulator [Kocuria sp. M1R5S2]|uniref:AfsR/SARP family transcriptional regulator n=1 Tax=Kocuria rhizosphaerae TaxID=3376285 RepID=UPI0037938DC5